MERGGVVDVGGVLRGGCDCAGSTDMVLPREGGRGGGMYVDSSGGLLLCG